MPDRQWISQSAEALVQALAASAAQPHDCDVLIIGSGYGAAVAAAHLAGARPKDGGDEIRVFVLERGVEYLPGTFPTRFADLPGHVRFSTEDGAPPRGRAESLFDLRIGAATSVLVANGLGGGSLINAAVLAEPKAEAFAKGWPAGISLETLQPIYRQVRTELGGNDLSASGFEPPKLAALFGIGKAMGAPDEDRSRATLAIHAVDGRSTADVIRSRCLNCGDCVTGCNHAAKSSLDVTYLRKARDLGAQLYCGATVHRVEPLGAGREGWNVQAFFTDQNKGYADASPCFTIRARIVVLGAGALGSTEILLRSAAELGTVNVGTRFSGNGDAIAIVERLRAAAHASAREQDAPATRRIGPTINGMVFVRDEAAGANPWLLFQEFAIPAALRRVLGEVAATVGLLQRLAQPDDSTHAADTVGDEPEACADTALEHLAVVGMQGDDGASACVRLASGADAVLSDAQVCIDNPDPPDLYDVQLDRLTRALAAESSLGGRVLPNPLWKPLPNLPLGRTVTVHPLGGCPMGDDPATSAVDPLGRVRKGLGDIHRSLVVLDGAAVPTSLGANPALTIAALAERAMPELMESWGLVPARWASPGERSQPVWRDTRAAQPVAPTVVELRERLTGRLRLGGRDWDAALTMRSAPIADLHAFVHHLPRTLALAQARLRLRSDDGMTLGAELSGRIHLLHRLASTAASRQAAVTQRTEAWLALLMGLFGLGDVSTHVGEVRSIDYELAVDSIEGDSAALWRGDRLRLSKRIAFEPRVSPWRQLSEAEVWLEGASPAQPLGRLALDFGDLAQQPAPLLRILRQQDQPNALGDLAALALLALRLIVKTRLPSLVEALGESLQLQEIVRPPDELRQARTPGAVRWRADDGAIVEVMPERHDLGSPESALLLFRYRPPQGAKGRPVLLIHGLGASGSTFAHWSIGVRSGADGASAGASMVAHLLKEGREVWVVELRTSIAHAGPPAPIQPWTLEEVAHGDVAPGDIEPAICKVLKVSGAERVDVVAHCIGAAMFCMAVLAAPCKAPLHPKIGSVVLSQVGPLMRLGALNRFRGLVASYLKQFISARVFDVRPPASEDGALSMPLALLDALLSTFPYPDGDRGPERNRDVPGFRVIRHRADAIWGRLMELDNVGDETLARLDEIYGFVAVETLAQTIHFARHSLLTDVGGANRFVAQSQLAKRFGFPVLLLHGRENAMFDWQGSYESLRLLKLAFGDDDVPAEQAPATLPRDGDTTWPPRARAGVLGSDTPRQLLLLDGYGHQDCLIGRNAHHDVFPRIVEFLDKTGSMSGRGQGPTPEPQLIAEAPWLGPMLGWPRAESASGTLHCRVVLRASPARFATLGVAFVPAVRREGRWMLALDQAVVQAPVPVHWPREPIEVALNLASLPQHDGFAVFTLHDDLPRHLDVEPRILGDEVRDGLFKRPAIGPDERAANALREAVQRLHDRIDLSIVRLTPSLVAGAEGTVADSLFFALASCQYPAGLLDREVAQASYLALAARLEAGTAPLPQGLLMVGDQIYADEAAGLFEPAGGAGGFARAYERGFRLPALRAVARQLPLAPMLDDHEVRDDWEPLQPAVKPLLADGLGAFAEFQHVLAPADARLDGTVFAYRLKPAGFPLLVLDSRTLREARSLRPGARGTPLDAARILPPAAIEAIGAWLDASGTGRPVFIVSPSLVFPFEHSALRDSTADRLRVDAWSGFPASLVALFERIAAHAPRELVFLSGDAHLSLVSSLRFTVGNSAMVTVHSIVSSGTYTPWPFANTAQEDLQLDGELRYRLDGVEVLKGSVETPVVVRTPGVALIDVRRDAASGGWRLAVEFDRPDECVRCSRLLGTQGAWQVSRFRR